MSNTSGGAAVESSLPPSDIVALSGDLLGAVRTDGPVDEYVEQVAALDESSLDRLGDDQGAAKAFWINCYLIQRESPAVHGGRESRKPR